MFRVRIEIFLEINVEFKMLNCYFMLIIIFYLFFFVLHKVNKTKDVSNYKKEHKQFNMDVVSALQNQAQEYTVIGCSIGNAFAIGTTSTTANIEKSEPS